LLGLDNNKTELKYDCFWKKATLEHEATFAKICSIQSRIDSASVHPLLRQLPLWPACNVAANHQWGFICSHIVPCCCHWFNRTFVHLLTCAALCRSFKASTVC
jgi:hypothetical protein